MREIQKLPDVESTFHLLIELEDRGVTGIVTDGAYVYLFPKDKASLRLRGDVIRLKRELLRRLPWVPPNCVPNPATTERL